MRAEASPEPGPVWHYTQKFEGSLQHMILADTQAHLQFSKDEDTLGSVVSALLLEPWAIKAFWESWGPCTGKAGTRYAVGNLRKALLAAARAGQKLREQDREAHDACYAVALVAGQSVQLLGVAQTCTRLGVLERVIARPKPKAGDIVYVLGAAQGVVYRERPANDRLEAFCEAFKNPWRCQETNPSRARPERGFTWTGRKVRSQRKP